MCLNLSMCFHFKLVLSAIGTNMAPAYANIDMSIFERNLLSGSCDKPFVRFRYIDDTLATWTIGEEKCKYSLLFIKSVHYPFSLPVVIVKNVFSFWMSQFLLTILAMLRQIFM